MLFEHGSSKGTETSFDLEAEAEEFERWNLLGVLYKSTVMFSKGMVQLLIKVAKKWIKLMRPLLVQDAANAPALAQALCEGGLTCIEAGKIDVIQSLFQKRWLQSLMF